MTLTVTAINRYPVKSCRGESLQSATVEPWGLAGDRRWMLIDDDNETATAREHHRLVLVDAQLSEGGIRLQAPTMSPLDVATPDGSAVNVTVHRHGPYPAVLASDDAHTWFSDYVGERVRLVHQPDPSTRPTYANPDDRVSLADSYPLLVATEQSLAALNDAIADGPLAHEGPVPMTRFRPNLVIRGADAWSEDGWRRVRIGYALFRAVQGCARCVLTTVDPVTATNGKEPIATLARIRRWDGQTWFGMQLIPDSPGVEIRVGDAVEIVESVDALDGPPR